MGTEDPALAQKMLHATKDAKLNDKESEGNVKLAKEGALKAMSELLVDVDEAMSEAPTQDTSSNAVHSIDRIECGADCNRPRLQPSCLQPKEVSDCCMFYPPLFFPG